MKLTERGKNNVNERTPGPGRPQTDRVIAQSKHEFNQNRKGDREIDVDRIQRG